MVSKKKSSTHLLGQDLAHVAQELDEMKMDPSLKVRGRL